MGNRRRVHKNKQRGMNQRLRGSKKPMCEEEKLARKKLSEKHRAMTKAALEKQSKE